MRKKRIKLVQAIMGFLLCVNILAACSGNSIEEKLPGAWKKANRAGHYTDQRVCLGKSGLINIRCIPDGD